MSNTFKLCSYLSISPNLLPQISLTDGSVSNVNTDKHLMKKRTFQDQHDDLSDK